jgi:hypothetical protein
MEKKTILRDERQREGRLEFLNLSLHIPAPSEMRDGTESMEEKETNLRDER